MSNHREWQTMGLDRWICDEHNALYDAWRKAEAEAERLGKVNNEQCDRIAELERQVNGWMENINRVNQDRNRYSEKVHVMESDIKKFMLREKETLDENNRLDRELDEARQQIKSLSAPVRVPFTDAQIEKMARAFYDARWGHGEWDDEGSSIKDMNRQAIRAALAAGGIEPCAPPEYNPDDVALRPSEPVLRHRLADAEAKIERQRKNLNQLYTANAALRSELAAVKAERDRVASMSGTEIRNHVDTIASLRADLAALRQPGARVPVMWDVTPEEFGEWIDQAIHESDAHDTDLLHSYNEILQRLAAHAAIDVPPGVPSVKELARIGYDAAESVDIFHQPLYWYRLPEANQEQNVKRATAIRDRIVAALAPRQLPSREEVARVLNAAWRKHRGYSEREKSSDPLPSEWFAEADAVLALFAGCAPATTPEPTDAQVESLARVLCAAYHEDNEPQKTWVEIGPDFQDHYLREARAAFAHIGAVPEPEAPKGLPTAEELARALWSALYGLYPKMKPYDYISALEQGVVKGAADAILTALRPWLHTPVGATLDVSVNALDDAMPVDSFAPEFITLMREKWPENYITILRESIQFCRSRITPMYECAECALYERQITAIRSVCDTRNASSVYAARAALEGE